MNSIKEKKISYKKYKIFSEFLLIFGSVIYLTSLKFQEFFFSNGQKIIGDHGDPRYMLFMFEHIYQSFSNNIFNIINPPHIYPYKWTITFSDWILFPGFFHSIFRTIGLDLFNSFEYSVVLCNGLFLLFLYLAIRSLTGLNIIFSLYFSLLIAYGKFLLDYRYWLQNFVIFFVPLCFIFLFIEEKERIKSINFRNFIFKNKDLISGLIVMLTLFSNFYIGASLLVINFLYFIINEILEYPKNINILGYFFYKLFSKRFVSLFAPSLLFIILNIPGLLITDISEFSSDFSNIKIKDYYFYPFSIVVLLGWLELLVQKYFLKKKIILKSIQFKFLLILTGPFLFYGQFIPDLFNISNTFNYFSINQIYSYKFGTVFRDHTRFFYPFYLLSVIFFCNQIRIITRKLDVYLKKINFTNLRLISPLILAILFISIYKLNHKFLFNRYTHDFDVQMHKDMLLDARNQLSEQKNCESFYLESYDNNHQINQISALLIAITSKVPTLNGYPSAAPKGWPLQNSTGYYNSEYVKNINKLIENNNLDKKTVCKVEYRKPPFKQLSLNDKSLSYIYNNANTDDLDLKYTYLEKEGNFSLLKDQYGGYGVEKILINSKGEPIPDLNINLISDKNAPFGIGLNSPYTAIAVDELKGIKKLLAYNHLNSNIEIFELDDNWKIIKKTNNIFSNGEDLNSLNKLFKVEFGFDRQFIDKQGNFSLLKDQFGTYYVKNNLKEEKILNSILRNSRIVGFSIDLPSYNLVGVEEIDGIRQIIDYTPYNKTAYIWRLDPNWNFVKDFKIISGEGEDFIELEKTFNLDINSDGFIGSIKLDK